MKFRKITNPEFVNLQPTDINPLMSSCEIKVMYVGENRNQSYISKQVALEMSKTLRGAPIIGYFKEDVGDFRDHGEELVLDGDGIHFFKHTRPYGFVSPNAEVWFQQFEEEDETGRLVVRDYLMTQGFLWTGQYEEAKLATEGDGRPHSMELDKDSIQGHWSYNEKGLEVFIVNDAIFSSLCILGEDVEPCFEGSAVRSSFTLDEDFKHTMFSMVKDIEKYQSLKGETSMENEIKNKDDVSTEFEGAVEPEDVDSDTDIEGAEEPSPVSDEPKCGDPEVQCAPPVDSDEDLDELKRKVQDMEDLEEQFALLKTEVEELRQFKRSVENKAKDELIERFSLLSDEDKADVIENKENYSLEQIEEKLSVLYVRKGLTFSAIESDGAEENKETVTTFTLNVDTVETENVPGWVQAVMKRQKGEK